jgi:hypothetical protein
MIQGKRLTFSPLLRTGIPVVEYLGTVDEPPGGGISVARFYQRLAEPP